MKDHFTCASCGFFHSPQKHQNGECRRCAPRPMSGAGLKYDREGHMAEWDHAVWPVVSMDDWCGAYHGIDTECVEVQQ